MTQKRKGEASRWFQQAAHDLKAARWNVQGAFHDTACFLSQHHAQRGFRKIPGAFQVGIDHGIPGPIVESFQITISIAVKYFDIWERNILGSSVK